MNPEQAEGILLVDKPGGLTSHDVVNRIRRIYQMKKVGHAGTLDPMATGLMILLVGKATKVSQYLISLPKTYEGCARFGETTDTQDADGDIVESRSLPEGLSADVLRGEMRGFLGDQYQTPPMFSAKKIKGVPLYKLARKGQEVEREPRVIHVASFELLQFKSPDLDFRLHCSKGTYVRTVLHDLGEQLGCGAHLTALRRTRIDQFEVADAATLETLEAETTPQKLARLLPMHRFVPSHVL